MVLVSVKDDLYTITSAELKSAATAAEARSAERIQLLSF